MAIELPPMVIYPDNYGTIRLGGNPAPFPAQAIAIMHAERSAAYAKGHWAQMIQNHVKMMRNNTPVSYGLDGIIIGEFKVGSATDAIMLRNPSLTLPQAWEQGVKEGAKIKTLAELAAPVEFSGGVFTPFRALIHWVVGKGAQAKVNIKNIGISPSPQKIPDLLSIINGAQPGRTQVDLKVPYNTGMDSAVSRIYLGSITLRIQGEVVRTESGVVTFTGKVKAYSDRYDANASSHRGGFDEGATTALREMGRVANAQDYEILIEGELPIQYKK
ncbi:lipid II-degrading bacteriocin [Pseudomonas monteilii]|uniref:lipid II-degrading bacteriocin n=1 Tax=Pseudomonas monteilii TaxID=76759 RepID=UPI0035262514